MWEAANFSKCPCFCLLSWFWFSLNHPPQGQPVSCGSWSCTPAIILEPCWHCGDVGLVEVSYSLQVNSSLLVGLCVWHFRKCFYCTFFSGYSIPNPFLEACPCACFFSIRWHWKVEGLIPVGISLGQSLSLVEWTFVTTLGHFMDYSSPPPARTGRGPFQDLHHENLAGSVPGDKVHQRLQTQEFLTLKLAHIHLTALCQNCHLSVSPSEQSSVESLRIHLPFQISGWWCGRRKSVLRPSWRPQLSLKIKLIKEDGQETSIHIYFIYVFVT